VAVTTLTNEFPTWNGYSNKPSLFGYPIPDNVKAVDHSYDVLTDCVRVAWATYSDPQVKLWHQMTLERPITEEQITALIVAMKLSC
jgi:hypothetical protein